MSKYIGITGTITEIRSLRLNSKSGCNKLVIMNTEDGQPVHFLVTPDTYFINCYKMRVGHEVTAFYNGNAPMLMIYPPQFYAIAVVNKEENMNVRFDHFDENLVSSDGSLQLIVDADTEITLENGQDFDGNPGNMDLLVFYTVTSRSIPAQTTPVRIVAMCR